MKLNMNMTMEHPFYDIAVIGGGLTGLTTAIYAARSGRSVILLEKDSHLGGLAQTARIGGALFNYGPRAMYEGSAALRILEELGCKPSLGSGTKNAMYGILDGRLIHANEELNPEEQTEWSTLMGSLNRIDPAPVRSISMKEWAMGHVRSDRVRQFFYAMCRQWAYDDDMERLSAGYVLEQGQLASHGDRYVLGGWQTVIDSLQREAVRTGVVIAAGAEAAQIVHEQGAVTGILLSDSVRRDPPQSRQHHRRGRTACGQQMAQGFRLAQPFAGGLEGAVSPAVRFMPGRRFETGAPSGSGVCSRTG